VPRGSPSLGHVAPFHSPLICHVSPYYSSSVNQSQLATSAGSNSATTSLYHHATSLPRVSRTDCTDRYSQHHFFCLFGSTNRSRYLLHMDSICESKYTAGIRKMRRMQWHHFRRIPSTLKIEQIFDPWSRF
jgi:hypothetical protein